jgi:hypothetical protein
MLGLISSFCGLELSILNSSRMDLIYASWSRQIEPSFHITHIPKILFTKLESFIGWNSFSFSFILSISLVSLLKINISSTYRAIMTPWSFIKTPGSAVLCLNPIELINFLTFWFHKCADYFNPYRDYKISQMSFGLYICGSIPWGISINICLSIFDPTYAFVVLMRWAISP